MVVRGRNTVQRFSGARTPKREDGVRVASVRRG